MVNFVFAEIGKTNNNNQNNNYQNNNYQNKYIIHDKKLASGRLFKNDFSSFIVCTNKSDEKLISNNITNNFISSRYKPKTKYTLLYLYDMDNQNNLDSSISFLKRYGGKLHNYSSANFTIISYFTEDMCKSWENVQNRDLIECTDVSYIQCARITRELKEAYNVKTKSAIVVIKYDKQTDEEEFFTIDVNDYREDTLYQAFIKIMSCINENCESSFEMIRSKLEGPTLVKKTRQLSNCNEFIDKYISKARENGITILQIDLANELCISERNFRDKKNNNKFTRDECIYLALRLNATIKKLNELLWVCDHADLGVIGREGIIRRRFEDNENISPNVIYELENNLVDSNYKKLISKEIKD